MTILCKSVLPLTMLKFIPLLHACEQRILVFVDLLPECVCVRTHMHAELNLRRSSCRQSFVLLGALPSAVCEQLACL